MRIRTSRHSVSQPTCFKVQRRFFFSLFRSSIGRLAEGCLAQMQSEKRLRGHTFYVNPDSGADSHDRRSVSSRWQWSRSHFVQTNNTAFYSPPPGEQTDAEVAPDTSLPTNQTTDPITARPARSPARPLIIPQPATEDGQIPAHVSKVMAEGGGWYYVLKKETNVKLL